MPFSVTTTRVFCAAHAIRFPDGAIETLHGHNWEVRVTVGAERLDAIGFVMDFHDLESQLDAILLPLKNANLNDVIDLTDLNPTAENVAFHIARRLSLPPHARLESVEVTEAPGCIATYRP